MSADRPNADHPNLGRTNWHEASARERVAHLLDPGSFQEILGPGCRETSPHLPLFDLPVAFDDGMIVGRGRLNGRDVLVAAQEGRFMGGTFGEIAGAKLVGLLRAARDKAPLPVLLALDSGGVRLQEANAGELAVSETIRAIVEARAAGSPVIALVGGRAGAFGGAGIVAATCGRIIVSEQARIGVTGPEVIETNKGVEEFDSKDRALVWRITGGRTRRALGGADFYVPDDAAAFRDAAIESLAAPHALDLSVLAAEQARLASRLAAHGDARDTQEIFGRDLADASGADFAQYIAGRAQHHDAR